MALAFPEKLIPVIISKILKNKQFQYMEMAKILEIYVLDHVDCLYTILKKGKIGDYNIGTNNELENIKICKMICLKITN